MPDHPTQDIGKLIADLRQKHPRLLLLIGEGSHRCTQIKKLENTILTKADVGFFELPFEEMKPHQKIKGELIKVVSDRILQKMPEAEHPHSFTAVQQLPIPGYAVLMDENHEVRHKMVVAIKARDRLIKDKTPWDDPVWKHVSNIYDDRAYDRLRTSNPHMAKVIVDHLKTQFPDQKPFFGVVVVGNGHIRSRTKLQPLLQQQGFDVITMEFMPKLSHYSQNHKKLDYCILKKAINGIDFRVNIQSNPAELERER